MDAVCDKLVAIRALELNAEVSLLVDLLGFDNNVCWIETSRITTNVRALHRTSMPCFLKLFLTSVSDHGKLVQIHLSAFSTTSDLRLSVAIGMSSSLCCKQTPESVLAKPLLRQGIRGLLLSDMCMVRHDCGNRRALLSLLRNSYSHNVSNK
jgi:hypothetical protein